MCDGNTLVMEPKNSFFHDDGIRASHSAFICGPLQTCGHNYSIAAPLCSAEHLALMPNENDQMTERGSSYGYPQMVANDWRGVKGIFLCLPQRKTSLEER